MGFLKRTSALAVALCVQACAPASSHPGSELAVAPATSGATSTLPTAVGPVSSASTAPATSSSTAPVGTLALALEIARRHAPLYRFNAWVPTSNSIANVSEDYFPMSVKEFFDELASGKPREVTLEATGPAPGENALVAAPLPVIDADLVKGCPGHMAGSAPGDAPVYFHVYEDASKRVRNPDGSGTDLDYVEFYLFYGKDRSRERILGQGPILDLGGHKGDWEAISLAVTVLRAAGGVFSGTRIERAYYTGHGHKNEVDLADLELVDDAAQPDPRGAHPVAYVSTGKHASFPHAGYWPNNLNTSPFLDHDEYFLGNGIAWSSWQSPLLDLEGPSSPEFEPPSFETLQDPTFRARGITDWRRYPGRFGDDVGYRVPLLGISLPLGDSPRGPKFQSFYGSADRKARAWAHVVATSPALVQKSFPPVVPAPYPIRK